MNAYIFDMIGWFGLDYKPLTMLWSVPQEIVFLQKCVLVVFDMYLIMFDIFSEYLRLS